MDWKALAQEIAAGRRLTRGEGLAVLRAPDEETLAVLDAAAVLRRRAHGNRVRIHVLRNAKSGLCPEDCGFCSQSSVATGPVEKYRLQTVDQLVAGARKAKDRHAIKYCIVTSTRGPADAELDRICAAVRAIKAEVAIRICTSLGLLDDAKARRLKEAGVDRFNHNLETSERMFPTICTTHTYQDRVATIRAAKRAGMEACAGGILGMGETDEDVVDLAFALRDLEVESIPVNLFNARPGTPLADVPPVKPLWALRALALFRLVNPDRDIRIAGGREVNLGTLQPLALFAANSLFTEGYLTTPGQGYESDLKMIRDLGLEIEEIEEE